MENKTHPLAKLAKTAVEHYIKEGKTVAPPNDLEQKYLMEKAGVFVSLHQNGELRGCIGTCLPTKNNIAEETINNAIAAAAEDPRFYPIENNDLPELEYEVYVLQPPEPVRSMEELNPKIFGVIVAGKLSKRSALLLPGLEGIDTVRQQLECATRKAGIDLESEIIAVQKFRAEKFR